MLGTHWWASFKEQKTPRKKDQEQLLSPRCSAQQCHPSHGIMEWFGLEGTGSSSCSKASL